MRDNVRCRDIASFRPIRLHWSGFGRIRVLELIVEVHTVLSVLVIRHRCASYTATAEEELSLIEIKKSRRFTIENQTSHRFLMRSSVHKAAVGRAFSS